MKRKYIAAILTVFAMTSVCSTAFGATEQAILSNAVGPLRLKSKYYFNGQMVELPASIP